MTLSISPDDIRNQLVGAAAKAPVSVWAEFRQLTSVGDSLVLGDFRKINYQANQLNILQDLEHLA